MYVLCVCVCVCVFFYEWESACQNIEKSGCLGQGQIDVVLTVLFNIKYQTFYAV